jgi:hypothetical protein
MTRLAGRGFTTEVAEDTERRTAKEGPLTRPPDAALKTAALHLHVSTSEGGRYTYESVYG